MLCVSTSRHHLDSDVLNTSCLVASTWITEKIGAEPIASFASKCPRPSISAEYEWVEQYHKRKCSVLNRLKPGFVCQRFWKYFSTGLFVCFGDGLIKTLLQQHQFFEKYVFTFTYVCLLLSGGPDQNCSPTNSLKCEQMPQHRLLQWRNKKRSSSKLFSGNNVRQWQFSIWTWS